MLLFQQSHTQLIALASSLWTDNCRAGAGAGLKVTQAQVPARAGLHRELNRDLPLLFIYVFMDE